MGIAEEQWLAFLRVTQLDVLPSVSSRPKCPAVGKRGSGFGFILQFQNSLVSVVGRHTGGADVVGFNGTYRLLSDAKFFMTDGTDQITVRFRLNGRELTLKVIEINGRRPFSERASKTDVCACFEMTLGVFPFFRVG